MPYSKFSAIVSPLVLLFVVTIHVSGRKMEPEKLPNISNKKVTFRIKVLFSLCAAFWGIQIMKRITSSKDKHH